LPGSSTTISKPEASAVQKGVSFKSVARDIHAVQQVLLCCSKAALTSWWVENEIDSALEKERRLLHERGQKVLAMIPLDLDGYLHSDEWRSARKDEVLARLAPDFRAWKSDEARFDEALQKLLSVLTPIPLFSDHPPD
jgi:hypothetical protein